MLGLYGYLKTLNFSEKYRSTSLVNDYSPVHDGPAFNLKFSPFIYVYNIYNKQVMLTAISKT